MFAIQRKNDSQALSITVITVNRRVEQLIQEFDIAVKRIGSKEETGGTYTYQWKGCKRANGKESDGADMIKYTEARLMDGLDHNNTLELEERDTKLNDVDSLLEHLTLIHIDLEDKSSASVSEDNASFCSRNVLRKQRHWEKIIMAKKSKRKQEKERRKAKQSGNTDTVTSQQLHSKRFLKALTKDRLLEAKNSGPRLCIDLSMTDHMSKKELSRLAAQIRRLYGSNKKSAKPFWLYLTGFGQHSLLYDECVRMNDGFVNYLVDSTESGFLDMFPLKSIIYLTPDSDNVLEDIDPSKVYVLGGLVDESIQKKVTYHKAKENGLQTARLPIQEYMIKKDNEKNFHSEILAINQVFDILSTYHETKSWPKALKAGVSPGKGFVLRDDNNLENKLFL
ncbi:PREDICTED: tRNA methyltransferase 10 homolog B [Nanorana parkeri]|uniref:tRNA methyltransferase 10 homolog B n=1 Tax=Nanorana parkeri TaxID=125878 RepID=UPI000854C909|nr:PREDICTED: tRNA methyltransferase 10 homolog B [Nanorana parkeri]